MAVPVINGTPVTSLSGSSDPTNLASFSTSGAGKVIVIAAINGAAIAGVSGGSLTFTSRGSSGGGGPIEIWAADSSGAVGSSTIAIDLDAAPSFISAVVFGVGTTTGFDSNGALPDIGTSDADATVSTTANDTMVIGAFRGFTEDNATPATWTEVVTAGYLSVYYKTFTAPQTSLAVPKPAGETVNGRIGDALAGTASAAAPKTLMLMGCGA